jgi:hypothetical protein
VHTSSFCSSSGEWLCCGKKAREGREMSVPGCLAVEHTTDIGCKYLQVSEPKLLFRKQELSEALVTHVRKHGELTQKQLYMECGIMDAARCHLVQNPANEATVYEWQLRAALAPIQASAKDALGPAACCVRQARRPVEDKFMPPSSMVAGQSKRRRITAPYLLVCKCDVKRRTRRTRLPPNDTE